MKKFFSLFILVLVLSCTKKDHPLNIPVLPSPYDAHSEPYGTITKEWPAASCPTVSYVYLEKFRYQFPSVNPENPYEFSFLRIRNASQTPEDCDLFTYNLETNKVRQLASHLTLAPDWGPGNWIAFTTAGAGTELWKIKSNGDSLTKLVGSSSPQLPEWSPDGKTLLYFCKVCGVMKLCDASGVFIKALKSPVGMYEWRSNNELLFFSAVTNSQTISTYNIEKDSVTYSMSGIAFPKNGWSYDGKTNLAYNSGDQLISYNAVSGPFSPRVIKANDQWEYNASINISNDRIISQKNIQQKMITEMCQVNSASHISVMNMDGSNERKILIPEE